MLALVGYNTSMISSFSLDPTGPLFGSASFPQSQYTPKISHLALLKNVYLLLNIEERSSTLRMIGKETMGKGEGCEGWLPLGDEIVLGLLSRLH